MSEPSKYIRKPRKVTAKQGGVNVLGRVAKGIKCSVTGCSNDAIRSLQTDKVKGAGLKVNEARRSYLCREHYKEFKKQTKKDRTLEKWRHGTPGAT